MDVRVTASGSGTNSDDGTTALRRHLHGRYTALTDDDRMLGSPAVDDLLAATVRLLDADRAAEDLARSGLVVTVAAALLGGLGLGLALSWLVAGVASPWPLVLLAADVVAACALFLLGRAAGAAGHRLRRALALAALGVGVLIVVLAVTGAPRWLGIIAIVSLAGVVTVFGGTLRWQA